MNGTASSDALCGDSEAGKCLAVSGSNMNGYSVVFVISTTGLQNIQLSYNLRRPQTGFSEATWAHSTDGINFTTDATVEHTYITSSTISTYSVDFSNATEINNQELVYMQ